MRVFRQCLIIVTSLFLSVLVTLGSANADGHKGFKLGVVTFLSGPAAEPFGVPAWNGGKLFIDLLNAGKAPAPYDKVGFGGMKITAIPIDESGGATKQVQEFRNFNQVFGPTLYSAPGRTRITFRNRFSEGMPRWGKFYPEFWKCERGRYVRGNSRVQNS